MLEDIEIEIKMPKRGRRKGAEVPVIEQPAKKRTHAQPVPFAKKSTREKQQTQSDDGRRVTVVTPSDSQKSKRKRKVISYEN